ncbi:acetyltransferase [Phlyctema vagabunda]|uniref:Acetyltransferase n=1 Tax=Phlyctema vagabunda TaxID=108571 RepID=A0ABR4PIW0_9HELO
MRQDSLQKIMFPKAYANSCEEEEQIWWTVEGLQESLENGSCYCRKIAIDSDCYAGFAVWTLDYSSEETKQTKASSKKHESWNPKSLDIKAWSQNSKRLREERERVLRGQANIWRLNTISVASGYQRQGVGSMLLQWGYDQADANGWDAFFMASPDGVSLYEEFHFEAVGLVWTVYGTFTSMFRKSRSCIEKHAGQKE